MAFPGLGTRQGLLLFRLPAPASDGANQQGSGNHQQRFRHPKIYIRRCSRLAVGAQHVARDFFTHRRRKCPKLYQGHVGRYKMAGGHTGN